jgi:cytochrome c oxidase cbb3-type subunit III
MQGRTVSMMGMVLAFALAVGLRVLAQAPAPAGQPAPAQVQGGQGQGGQSPAGQTPAHGGPDAPQPPAPATPPRPGGGFQPPPPRFPAHQRAQASQETLDRGRAQYAGLCSACHGADARGGQLGGVNLLRSPVVLADNAGELIIPIVQNGRPGTLMAPMPMAVEDIKAVAAYLHSLQAQGSNQGGPPPGPPVELNILVGDAKAGAAYFAATCAGCHSATGDLQGIATRVSDPKALQNLWVSGGRALGRGPGRRAAAAGGKPVTATVTLGSGETVTGRLMRLDDFLVTVGLEDGTTRTIRRSGDSPRIAIDDPMERHRELLGVYTNQNMYDVTAYLATLK